MKEDIIAVVYKIDCLSRSLLDFFTLQKFFEQYNVSFCSVTQPISILNSSNSISIHEVINLPKYLADFPILNSNIRYF